VSTGIENDVTVPPATSGSLSLTVEPPVAGTLYSSIRPAVSWSAR
jgi:hypothetical protein